MAVILLIEDEEDMAREMRQLLEDERHQVDLARGYGEGVRRFAEGAYDLVLLDIIMPIGDDEGIAPEDVAYGHETGVALFQHIRKERPEQHVILSTVVRTDAILRKMDPDAILHKPFYPDELLETVNEVLAGGRSEDAENG